MTLDWMRRIEMQRSGQLLAHQCGEQLATLCRAGRLDSRSNLRSFPHGFRRRLPHCQAGETRRDVAGLGEEARPVRRKDANLNRVTAQHVFQSLQPCLGRNYADAAPRGVGVHTAPGPRPTPLHTPQLMLVAGSPRLRR